MIGMTGQDWYRLLDQGFHIEIVPPSQSSLPRKKTPPVLAKDKIPYGYVTQCGREFIRGGFRDAEAFAAKKRIPFTDLRQALYNLRNGATSRV